MNTKLGLISQCWTLQESPAEKATLEFPNWQKLVYVAGLAESLKLHLHNMARASQLPLDSYFYDTYIEFLSKMSLRLRTAEQREM